MNADVSTLPKFEHQHYGYSYSLSTCLSTLPPVCVSNYIILLYYIILYYIILYYIIHGRVGAGPANDEHHLLARIR